MQSRRLGRTGLKVTPVCLGTMTFGNQADQDTAFRIMDIADAAGVTFFDTADVYPLGGRPGMAGRTEEIVGNWLEARGARDRIVLATKCRGRMGPHANDEGLSRKHIVAACEASLRRLKTDYIDLYQTHHPDADTPIDETLRAFDDLVRAGKVRYVGCSNYQAWQIAEALWTSDRLGLARFDSVQPRYNLLFRVIEDEVLPLCRRYGLGVMAYNPLAAGVLTGRYRGQRRIDPGGRFDLYGAGQRYQRRYWNDAVHDAVDRLGDFFDPRGKSLTGVALAWTLRQPGITSAIVGASRPDQLEQSLAVLDTPLDDEELAVLDEAWFSLPRPRDADVALR